MEATTDSKHKLPKFNRLFCQKRPDPKRLSKSGSAKLEESRFRPDPDPQHYFLYVFRSCTGLWTCTSPPASATSPGTASLSTTSPASTSSIITISVLFVSVCVVDLEWFNPDLDPTIQVFPDPDPTLFKPGQLINWQIISVQNGIVARFFTHFKDFVGKCVCNRRLIKPFYRKSCIN